MKNVTVIGTGYVGLVTGTCLADLGNTVTCVDIDERKIAQLREGVMPIYEPGVGEMVQRNVTAGRLTFTTTYVDAIPEADIVFICVDTPSGMGGEADLKYVRSAAESIADHMVKPIIIVNRSTVPIGTGDFVTDVVNGRLKQPIDFAVVSNPEFTAEGSAVWDFMHPDRVVLGSMNRDAAEAVAQLYLPLRAPIMITDQRTSEMIKYASNAYLASRISFINQIATICEQLGADVREVSAGMGLDKRIGPHFLSAGIGWGGSCFPKDVKALEFMASVHGAHPQLLRDVIEINRDMRRRTVQRVRQLVGKLNGATVGILGLSFKPNTDDMREAPSVEIIRLLQNEGVRIRAYDPVAMKNAERLLRDVTLCEDVYEVAEGCDALIIVTEWNEFKNLDLQRIKAAMRLPILVDGRNLYDPQIMRSLGFVYRGVGRGYAGDREVEREPTGAVIMTPVGGND